MAERERRHDRPVTLMKLSVWQTEFDRATLHASERAAAGRLYTKSDDDRPIAMPLRLTAIALLLRPMGPWYVRR